MIENNERRIKREPFVLQSDFQELKIQVEQLKKMLLYYENILENKSKNKQISNRYSELEHLSKTVLPYIEDITRANGKINVSLMGIKLNELGQPIGHSKLYLLKHYLENNE